MRASLLEGAVQVVAVNDPFIDLDYMVSQAICNRTPISLQQSNMLCDVIKNFFFFLMFLQNILMCYYDIITRVLIADQQ